MSNLVEVYLPNGWCCKVNAEDVAEYEKKGFSRVKPVVHEREAPAPLPVKPVSVKSRKV